MKTIFRWVLACTLLVASLSQPVRAEQMALVKGNRVNVRGQATLGSEVITQLSEGETVTVLEEIPVESPKKGSPARWSKIKLPANTPVWVFAPYIGQANKEVRVNLLNIRAGPGEQYSTLGELGRGTVVSDIRVVGNWMEIETPKEAHAFVASEFLVLQPKAEGQLAESTTDAPAPETTPAETTKPAGTETIETVEVVESADTPVQPVATEDAGVTNVLELAVVEEEIEEPAKPRIVTREGIVIVTLSIQAPTVYALQSAETRRTINYLHSENLGINLKNFGGRRVIVSGEELLDPRWTNTPLLEVESLRLVP